MIRPGVLYVVHNDDTTDFGWTPDGEGMYWFEPEICSLSEFMEEVSDFPRRIFYGHREFDNYRYGPIV